MANCQFDRFKVRVSGFYLDSSRARNRRDFVRKLGTVACAAVLVLAATIVPAQPSAPLRLSDWLLKEHPAQDAYLQGLSWRVPEEVPAQQYRRLELLQILSGAETRISADPGALARLREWIARMPATGRVPVSVVDARWLQANPARDPVLSPGSSVILPKRPRTVTVVTSHGRRCSVIHSPGHEAADYARACDPKGASAADFAWIAQPDGRVQKFGVALWNGETQNEPSPGAWIWVPPRNRGWPAEISERLIAFLATQGPAMDSARPVRIAGSASQRATLEAPAERISPGGASSPWMGLKVYPPAGQTTTDSENAASDGETENEPLALGPAPKGLYSRFRSAEYSINNWGGVGLMQTPSARFEKAGHFSFALSRFFPYTNYNVFVNPIDGVEVGFRYTGISNRAYGSNAPGPGQNYKDKSIDLRLRLWSESAYLPQVAIGARDIAGNGFISSEYVVASKRTGPFDWSLGLGFGYMAGRQDIRSPLRFLGKSYESRTGQSGDSQGGGLTLGSYFRGPAAMFGGVQFQTPWKPLKLVMEYEGNNYQREPFNNNQIQRTPWNFGVVYKASNWVDLTLGVERGDRISANLVLRTQLDGLSTPKLNDTPRIPVAAGRPTGQPDWAGTSREIARQTEWQVGRIEQRGRELSVQIDNAAEIYWRERVERVAAVLHRDAPASIDRFSITHRQSGMDVVEHVVDREAWVAQNTQPLPPHVAREAVTSRVPSSVARGEVLFQDSGKFFESNFGSSYQQTLGGPDGFLFYQLGVMELAKLRLREDTWITGALRLGLVNNYADFKVDGPTELPPVRTFLRNYLTESRLNMPFLQATHIGKASENSYYSVYGGYLEQMFAGAGGEWLYRPNESRVALGVEANHVQQRGFKQDFKLRDYKVSTGHATLYWDTGWNNVLVNLSAGRYLARDLGATLQVSRIFENGVTVGAWATKTNVSALQFGEGSYDKGVFLSVPFDAFLTRSSNSWAHVQWRPLTRDGGAKLERRDYLYDITKSRDIRALSTVSAPLANNAVMPADRREEFQPKPTLPDAYVRMPAKPSAEGWVSDIRWDDRLRDELTRQLFRNVSTRFDMSVSRLTVSVSNDQIKPFSRAAGRAVRAALRLAPQDTRSIRLELSEGLTPSATYDFFDLRGLERYFRGEIGEVALSEIATVEFVDPTLRSQNAFASFGDLGNGQESSRLVDGLKMTTSIAGRVVSDVTGAATAAKDSDWVKLGAIGAGLTLASTVLDNRADTFARDHASNRGLKMINNAGNAYPWLAIAGAGMAALDGSDPRRSRTGYAATEAGGVAFLAVTGLKYVAGRARPTAGLGSKDFTPFKIDNNHDSFPSGHTILAWAVTTPFAEEYNAPWLYAAPLVTNLARVGSRNHWVSDTVVGSLLGYGIGRYFWESSRKPAKGEPRVMLQPSGVSLAWEFK